MSFFDTEKLQGVQKANLDMLQQLNSKVFEGFEQLSQLQLKTLRQLSEEQFETCRQLLAVRDPQAFLQLQGSLVQPAAQAERLLEFNRKVYDLMASTQAEVSKFGETQLASGAKQVHDALETLGSNAPASVEPAVAMFRSAVESAGSVLENAQKVARQAAEMAESNMAAATSAATSAASQAAQAATQAATQAASQATRGAARK